MGGVISPSDIDSVLQRNAFIEEDEFLLKKLLCKMKQKKL